MCVCCHLQPQSALQFWTACIVVCWLFVHPSSALLFVRLLPSVWLHGSVIATFAIFYAQQQWSVPKTPVSQFTQMIYMSIPAYNTYLHLLIHQKLFATLRPKVLLTIMRKAHVVSYVCALVGGSGSLLINSHFHRKWVLCGGESYA